MRATFALLTLLLLSPLAVAQPKGKAPEQLLAADSVFYLRYDGYEPHRKAYDQTALATAMKEGLGEFLDHVFSQLSTLADGNFPPRNLKKDAMPRPEVDAFLAYVWKHGFALGVESIPPKRGAAEAEEMFQFTLVFPQGAEKGNRPALEKFIRMLAATTEAPIEEVKEGTRKIHTIKHERIKAAWWPEGPHLVLTLGTRPVSQTMRVIDGTRANLTTTPWYAEFAGFKRYETDMRGYVDLPALVTWLGLLGLDEPGLNNFKDRLARQILLSHVGLTGVKDMTFHLGFDGKYQRSTVRVGVVEPERRRGLLHLLAGTITLTPDKLPALPPDSDYVSIRHVNWEDWYDFVRGSYSLAAVGQFLTNGNFPERFPDLDLMLGGDFRKDFLHQLDTTVVTYGAHSEGPFFLGQGFAVKVKDAAKMRKTLEAMTKALGQNDPLLASDKRMFRGEPMYVFSNLYLPVTLAVHQNWLVVGLFPQPVQGFILRSNGKYRSWKAPPELAEVLAKERKENPKGKVFAVTVSDPRPAVEIGLALLPTFVQIINQSAGSKVFDVSKIPNAQSVNEWLFPNVSIAYDDGNALRWEHHYSMNEPDDFLLSTFAPLGLDLLPLRIFAPAVGMAGEGPPMREDAKRPFVAVAQAAEKDGAIQLEISYSKQIPHTVIQKVAVIEKKKVVVNGVAREVAETVFVDKETVVFRAERQLGRLLADGKNVKVSRKDGTAVEPKKLLKLLEKQTRVLLVTKDEVDPKYLQGADDDTLIIRAINFRAIPAEREPKPPPRKVRR